ncbi:hypothetical protein QC764_211130 [Podospora pseudoanserina]|uniref:Telomeric single stranded DNA binding POT1/Cdc13 domain-containing protein n=1 Tax=Podospora pseudoanserina TaxID=2609844 RepID=A0ABR0IIV7_9PEZI|nr:hypothetical protein QC764_211130 [Podospora pseudoanserina]
MEMAEDGNVAALLATKLATPIAQLGPDLPDQPSRTVRGEVGITWPYNSVTETFAFLLAEPDVRLRRARGQVRIELHGPSARILSKCGLGAGDELLFSLEEVTWTKDTSPGGIPGSRVEWQLQFDEKFVLQIKSGETNQLRHLNIDHPELETEASPRPPAPPATAPRLSTPEPEEPPEHVPTIRKFFEVAENEYASPALIKRQRLSYGALFEDGFDPFEEDGGVKGKGRKRTRFGRDSSAWRYTSQSPSPEPQSPAEESMDEDVTEKTSPQPSPQKEMLDEGVQTVDIEMTEPTDEAVQTEPVQPESTRVEAAQTEPMETEPVRTKPVRTPPVRTESAMDVLSQAALAHAQQAQKSPASEEHPRLSQAQQEKRSPVAQEQPALTMPELPPATPQHDQASGKPTESRSSPPAANANTDMPKLDAAQKPATDTFASSSLFGTPKTPGFSMFGTGPPARIQSPSSIADQVRFGFSHIPHTAPPPDAHDQHFHGATGFDKNEAYPDSYLDDAPSGVHINNYFASADTQDLPIQQPPMAENFDNNQWTVTTESPRYNQTEGGHFGDDALEEGTRMPPGDAALHAAHVTPNALPDGFASYGHGGLQGQFADGGLATQEARGYGEGDDSLEEDAVGVDDEEDQDAVQDEYAYGEPIEEGDYDQRNYVEPSDDDEGLSEQEEEVHQEIVDRYGDAGVLDESEFKGFNDLSEDQEEDDEEEYDDEEEGDEYDDYEEAPAAKPVYTGRVLPQANPKGPMVISLLSDSEDDDVSMPAPKAPPAAEPTQETPKSPGIGSDQVDPGLSEEVEESEEAKASEAAKDSQEDEEGSEEEDRELEEDVYDSEEEMPDAEEEVSEVGGAGVEYESASEDEVGDLEVEEASVRDEDEDEDEDEAEGHTAEGASDEDEEPEEETSGRGDEAPQPRDGPSARDEASDDEHEATALKGEVSKPKEAANEAEDEAPAVAGGQTHVVDFAVHQADGHEEQARAPADEHADKEDSFVISAPEDTDEVSGSESELEIEPPKVAAVSESEDKASEAEPVAASPEKAAASESEDKESEAEEPAATATNEAEEVEPKVDQSDAAAKSELERPDVTAAESASQFDVDDEPEHEHDADYIPSEDENDEIDVADDVPSGDFDRELEDFYDDMVLEQLEQEQANQRMASESADDKMSLASQVEADDDQMDVEDDHEKASTAEPMSVVDDDVDVDMLDAGTPHFESPMEAETPRAEVESSMIITEVIEEVVEETVIMEVTTEILVEDAAMDQEATEEAQEEVLEDTQQQEDTDAVEEVHLEPVKEAEEEVPVPVVDEEKPAVVSLEPVEGATAPANNEAMGKEVPASPPLTNSFASQKKLSPFAQGFQEAMRETELPPTPLQSMVQAEPEDHDVEEEQETQQADAGVILEQPGNNSAGSPDLSFNAGESDAEEVASVLSAPVRKAVATRASNRNKNKKKAVRGKSAQLELSEPPTQTRAVCKSAEEEITVQTPSSQEHMSPQPEMAASSSSSPDVSVKLAQQSVAARRSKRGQPQPQEPQPTRISPRLARRRSNSLQSSNQDAEEEPKGSFNLPSNRDLSVLLARGALASPSKGDVSVGLAKDALNSPSKTKSASPLVDDNNTSTAALKADLTKRLRQEFPDCINLTSLKYHVDEHPVVAAIVTSEPTTPVRAKKGPREYVMSFHITDPSIAPGSVVEVQLYRPHKESLPVVRVGDAVLLQRLQVKSISKKGFGLRSGEESSWAVFDADEGAPQVKGAPVEGWEGYRGYMTGLRGWWRSLDSGARGRVERADRKMREAK